jgi:hypothetical protein
MFDHSSSRDGLFIGAWVDRLNRKGLMIGLDIARVAWLALFGHLPIWWIYLVTFINSTLTVGFFSATTDAIPSLVDRDDLQALHADSHLPNKLKNSEIKPMEACHSPRPQRPALATPPAERS